MAAEFYAKLGIYSKSLTPDQVNTILGIGCDKNYVIGPILRPHAVLQREENSWFICSRIPRAAPMEDHIKDILERISSVKGKIRSIADRQDTEVQLGCVIHSKEAPPVFFSKEAIANLYQIGASIDIDLYYWEKDSIKDV